MFFFLSKNQFLYFLTFAEFEDRHFKGFIFLKISTAWVLIYIDFEFSMFSLVYNRIVLFNTTRVPIVPIVPIFFLDWKPSRKP